MHLVILLEERSAAAMLEGLLPRMLPEGITYRCIPFDGKSDLQKQLPIKLRGWRQPNTAFVVLHDQDTADCIALKKRLKDLCQQAKRPNTIVRIACQELESWYFGDLAAVETGLGLTRLREQATKAKYRNPDLIGNPAQELKSITHQKYSKIAGSRAIGPHLQLQNNTSHSFNVFLKGISKALNQIAE